MLVKAADRCSTRAARDVNETCASLSFRQHSSNLILGHVDIDIDDHAIGRTLGPVLAMDNRPATNRLRLSAPKPFLAIRRSIAAIRLA